MQKIPEARTNKTAVRPNEARIFCLLMVFFLIFEVFMTVVVLVRSISVDTDDPTPPIDTEETTDTPDPDKEPTALPVFSGGVIPAKPQANAQTKMPVSEIHSQYAILIDTQTGEIVAGKDYTAAFSPASMTKVMTLIVACENLTAEDLERKLVFDEEIHKYITSGSYAGTSPSLPIESNGYSCFGDTYRIKDLLYGIGVASAADCTYMIVKEIAGTEETFVDMMNQKARELGLSNTHFDNAVGFDSETNYTTAADMATVMNYAMQCDLIAEVLSKQKAYDIYAHYDQDGEEKTYKVTLASSWKSREDKYPTFKLTTSTVTASKTGYTDQSFMVLTAKANGDGQTYILVLGNKTSTADTITEKFRQTMVDIEYLLNNYVS